ncbi:MAG TPA: hypothetical protein VK994_04695, partial [Bacteroidales bacterium]|nr:hypothetical protein [Bacteroidales bacterium]
MDDLRQKQQLVKKSIFFFVLALIFISSALIYEVWMVGRSAPDMIAKEFQESVYRADENISSSLDSLVSPHMLADLAKTDSFILAETDHEYALYFFKYFKDTMVYWSDNACPLPEKYKPWLKNNGIIDLANGKYFYRDTLVGNMRTAALVLIKYNYPYQNQYLVNRYHKAFTIPPYVSIAPLPGDQNISNSRGGFLCSLDIPPGRETIPFRADVLLILYALAFLSLSAALYQMYQHFRSFLRSDLLLVITYSLDVIILRVLMFIFKIPSGLYESHLFSPGSFATSDYIPSLGDFLFNALALLAITYVLFITYKNTSLDKRRPPIRRYFLIFTLFLHMFIFYRLFLRGAESLIMDSSYSLNLNRFFFLSSDSFLALLTFTLLLFSFFLVSYRILGLAMHHSERKPLTYFGLFALTTAVYFLYCYFFHDCQLLLLSPLLVYVVVFFLLHSRSDGNIILGFTSSVLYLFIFAILSTAILAYYNSEKESEQRRLLAIDLSSGEDPLSEYVFQSMDMEMAADSTLLAILSKVPYNTEYERTAELYIEDNYLADRMRKYEWMVTVCTPYRTLSIQPEGYIVNCNEYFNGIIENIGQKALGENLYRYDNEAGMSNYIARHEYVLNDALDTVSVYIELYSFFFPGEGLGYPELLIDEKLKTFPGLENYSYARYKHGDLVFKYGDYPYSTRINRYLQAENESFFSHNMSTHLISISGPDEYLIISKTDDGLLEVVAPFSYLLIFFTLFILGFLLSINIYYTPTHLELNFRNRLQLYIISLIIISFVIIGFITVSYVIRLNTSKNQEILQEKTHSVLIELEHKLAGEEQLTP